MARPPETLLCVANFPANTGYAWDFIEGMYARIADHLAGHGVRTLVGYPALQGAPRTLAGSAAEAIALDASLRGVRSVRAFAHLIRRERIRVLYLCDRPVWNPAYLGLRWAGIRRLLVHDHTSGTRTPPTGLRRALKGLAVRLPGLTADVVIAVSDFVARRQVEAGLIPPERVVRVWNSAPADGAPPDGPRGRAALGIPAGRPVVMCVCRATPEKGVATLLRAFDRMQARRLNGGPRPLLVYVGDGPQLPALRLLRAELAAREDIILTGYRADARSLLAAADLCVAPSVWAEAFCLGVLEPMALGKAVVASDVGAIPELVQDGVTGELVPPGDEAALARALHNLLQDPDRRARFGTAARARAAEHFTPEDQLGQLIPLVEEGFGIQCAALSA